MIELQVEQGSDEWLAAHLGLPTASQYGRIVTSGGAPRMPRYYAPIGGGPQARAKKQTKIWDELLDSQPAPVPKSSALSALLADGHVIEVPPPAGAKPVQRPPQPSEQADEYADRLLAEWIQGSHDEEWSGTFWTDRGLAFEGNARDAFTLETGLQVRSTGLVYRDEARDTACSPDGLCHHGDPGSIVAGLELKCPKAATHLGYMREMTDGAMPLRYRMQVQASLWITRLPAWYFASYFPGLPLSLARVEPDPIVHAALDEHVPAFIARLAERRAELLAMGVEPAMAA